MKRTKSEEEEFRLALENETGDPRPKRASLKLLSKFLTTLHLNLEEGPVNVFLIAESLLIGIELKDIKYEGCLRKIDDSGAYKIYINKDLSRATQKFTLAHELGHFIFRRYLKSYYQVRNDKTSSNLEEMMCDLLAGEMLMPLRFTYERLCSDRINGSTVGLLSRELGVNKEALFTKIKILSKYYFNSKIEFLVCRKRKDGFINIEYSSNKSFYSKPIYLGIQWDNDEISESRGIFIGARVFSVGGKKEIYNMTMFGYGKQNYLIVLWQQGSSSTKSIYDSLLRQRSKKTRKTNSNDPLLEKLKTLISSETYRDLEKEAYNAIDDALYSNLKSKYKDRVTDSPQLLQLLNIEMKKIVDDRFVASSP